MTYVFSRDPRVLAIDPAVRGFGFALLEGADYLVDWGVKGARAKTQVETLQAIRDLVTHYEPDVLVLEDHQSSRRGRRVKALIEAIEKLATRNGVRCRRFSRQVVRRTFSTHDARTKHQIALNLALRFPELTPWVPPFRKPWMSEDRRSRIFGALALAVTFFDRQHQRITGRPGREAA